MKLVIVVAFIVLITGATFVGYASMRNGKLGREFDRTIKGETRESVIQRMGTPSYSNQPCQNTDTWVDQSIRNSRCATEIVYTAAMLPEYWTIGFDQYGRAVTKYAYVSP